jgi:hypothetical protein
MKASMSFFLKKTFLPTLPNFSSLVFIIRSIVAMLSRAYSTASCLVRYSWLGMSLILHEKESQRKGLTGGFAYEILRYA